MNLGLTLQSSTLAIHKDVLNRLVQVNIIKISKKTSFLIGSDGPNDDNVLQKLFHTTGFKPWALRVVDLTQKIKDNVENATVEITVAKGATQFRGLSVHYHLNLFATYSSLMRSRLVIYQPIYLCSYF